MTQPPENKSSAFQNLTAANAFMVVIAIISAIAIPPVVISISSSARPEFLSFIPAVLVAISAHLLVVALGATGFRRLSDVAAILVGTPLFLFGMLLYSLRGLGGNAYQDHGEIWIIILQLLMVVAAAVDLISKTAVHQRPVPLTQRARGLA